MVQVMTLALDNLTLVMKPHSAVINKWDRFRFSYENVQFVFVNRLVSNALENYWKAVKINDIITIYYPFYGVWFEREYGGTRVEVMDGISGTLN